MNIAVKRNLDELGAIYGLEPNLRDIFVEGWTDKYFIEWYLRKKNITNVSVYPIELVEVPNTVLMKYKLPSGSNRSRIIALSCELTERHGSHCKTVCLIDRDYEDYLPCGHANTYLVPTDTNSLELYAFAPSVIEKFLFVALGGFPLTAQDFVKVISGILGRVFAIRLTNERLQWGMSWVPFTKYVNVATSKINFREKDFLRAYLQKNNKWGRHKEFSDELSNVTCLLGKDLGRTMRGHDLIDLTFLLIKKLKKQRVYGNPETVEGCLLATIETDDLDHHNLFKRIVALAH